MLYFVLVYEYVLVQMLSARSVVLSFNRLSNHLFPTVHMRSFCCGSPGFLSSVPDPGAVFVLARLNDMQEF